MEPRAVSLFSLGHSNLSLESFLELLEAHRIEAVADVRSFPTSRRHPHFAGDALERSLRAKGIDYRWFPGLGGRRRPTEDSPHTGWTEPGFRAYADYMGTKEFQDALEAFLAWAESRRTAFLCAEKLWWQCHRRLLADRLVTLDHPVSHILDARRAEPHRLTEFLRVSDGRLIYDRDLFSGPVSSS